MQVLKNRVESSHVSLASDDDQLLTNLPRDRMLLASALLVNLANSMYQSGTGGYVDSHIEPTNIEETIVAYNEDANVIDYYENSVKAGETEKKKKKEKDTSQVLGPHFLVLSESAKKPHRTTNSFSNRQGMMEGLVGALGTTR